MNWKVVLFYVIIFPVAVTWDIVFFLVQALNRGMTLVDEKGAKILEDFKDRISTDS
jgi:hypothetical protein